MKVIIVPACPLDIRRVAERMRAADVEEIKASSGRTPEQALRRALKLSSHSWTAYAGGRPVAMFGCGGDGDIGCAWLLGTDWMEDRRNARSIWQVSKEYVTKMHRYYDVLFNYVDDRNTTSQRWLERLGFVRVKHEPHYGIERRPFTLFASYRPCANP